MMSRFLALGLILIIMACATTASIHQRSPDKTIFIANQHPEKLSKCIFYELKQCGYQIDLAEKDSSIYLFISTLGWGASPIGEIKLMPYQDGVNIELRIPPMFGLHKLEILPAIDRCLSANPVQNNPGK